MSLPFDAPAAEPRGMLISLILAGDILSPFSDLIIWGCGNVSFGAGLDEPFPTAQTDMEQHSTSTHWP
jgi:hypothetical protein